MIMKIRLGIKGTSTALFLLGSALVIGPGIGTAHADPMLWIDDTAGNVGTVDITTKAVTVIGNTGLGGNLTDLGFTANGNLYGTTFTGLYSISQTNGAASPTLGSYNLGGGGMNGLLGSGANLLASSNSTNEVYSLSPAAPGSSTDYAPSPGGSAGDLAFGPGGLYEAIVDPHTGVDALANINTDSIVGDFTGGLTSLFGLAYVDGVMYGIGGTEIYSVDLATAGLTPLFDYSGHGLLGANGAAVLGEAVPEPSSLAVLLAGFGLIGGAMYFGRRKVGAAKV